MTDPIFLLGLSMGAEDAKRAYARERTDGAHCPTCGRPNDQESGKGSRQGFWRASREGFWRAFREDSVQTSEQGSGRASSYDPTAAHLAHGALGQDLGLGGASFERLVAVISRLRRDCPWDAEQTHLTLVKHLIEEAGETVDAIEAGTIDDLKEELGDLLIQVCFHAEIARTEGEFTIDDVAAAVANKLITRHPYVFGDGETPTDMMASWEAAKEAEKQRESCLDGIPDAMNAVAKAAKVVTRVRDVHLDVPLADEPIGEQEVGVALLNLIERAQASGVDADQALRAALRALESQVRAAEVK